MKNPFNPRQIFRISLAPEDVDCFVFWTRNPGPMLPFLEELEERGYAYYFLITVTGYPQFFEERLQNAQKQSISTFKELSQFLGKNRVIWRYDPIIISNHTDFSYHVRQFSMLSSEFFGYTERVIISFLDIYRKVQRNLNEALRRKSFYGNIEISSDPSSLPKFGDFISTLRSSAENYHITVQTCAEEIDLSSWNIHPGKCIDDELIKDVFGKNVPAVKDPGQRPLCRCVTSKDIGAYNTCPGGCAYCYAVNSREKAVEYFRNHDETFSFL